MILSIQLVCPNGFFLHAVNYNGNCESIIEDANYIRNCEYPKVKIKSQRKSLKKVVKRQPSITINVNVIYSCVGMVDSGTENPVL
jgi:hypothetical protein